METRPQHWRLVAGLVPATTLSPVAYITTDFIGCAQILIDLIKLNYYAFDYPNSSLRWAMMASMQCRWVSICCSPQPLFLMVMA